MNKQNLLAQMKSVSKPADSVGNQCDHDVQRVNIERRAVDASYNAHRKTATSDSAEEAGASVDIGGLPHYSPQCPIYSLLFSALNLSMHYEKSPGAEERQTKLESLLKKYQKTCDALNEEAF